MKTVKMRAYSIRDNMLNMNYVPFFAENDKEAKKIIMHSLADDRNLLCVAAAKYDLRCVGEFDTDTGIFDNTNFETVCTLLELKGLVDNG